MPRERRRRMSGMSPFRSDGRPRYVVVGNPGCRRVELFQAALRRSGSPQACLVPWLDLATGEADLREVVRPGDVLRIESAGRDFAAERALLELGAEMEDEEPGHARLSRREVRALEFDRGRLLYPRQWYLGFRALLRRIASQVKDVRERRLMSWPEDIAVMFDKPLCHARLAAAGVAVPRALGPVTGFDDLQERMQQRGWRRVFLKPAHGSSAAGVVAYRTDGARHQAITPVEMVRGEGELRLYSSRQLRTYRDLHEIGALVDELGRHRLHVEEWLPKAGYQGRVFDLRVVVVAGQARHRVVRTSRTPITNLHLLNRRGDAEATRLHVGPARWEAALAECRRALECFPKSLYGGVDVMISSDHRRHAVLEVNAFGDLLPGLLHEGEDTYGAELGALRVSQPAAAGAAA